MLAVLVVSIFFLRLHLAMIGNTLNERLSFLRSIFQDDSLRAV